MIEIIIIVLVLYVVFYVKNADRKKSREQDPAKRMAARERAAGRRKPKASAIPNRPRTKRKKQEPEVSELQPDTRRKSCTYEAAYSKGKPSRIGMRGDYETSIPSGMKRVICSYCGAENFVPAESHEHYHCFFCWEKL